jgi:hypothetical protein
MRKLLDIRLSYMAVIFFAIYIILILNYQQQKLTPGQLALFSVNTFLFGYYFSPLLSAQKSRVANLISTTRAEAMTILDALSQSHLLNSEHRHQLKVKLRIYLDSIIENYKIGADNRYYDEILRWSKNLKGEDQAALDLIYDRIAKTQDNRDTLNNLLQSKVYSHEWLVCLVLFFITLYFALQTDFNGSLFFATMLAVLCTGLTLLMIILVKFATLTHKEARRMWRPLKDLRGGHFDDITREEAHKEKVRIDAIQA